MPAAAQRSRMSPFFQRFTLRAWSRTISIMDSTNPVESMIEIVRDHARNVKRWKNGDMRLRWAAAGMLAAAGQFRRVQGYAQLPGPSNSELQPADPRICQGLTLRCAWRSPPTSTISECGISPGSRYVLAPPLVHPDPHRAR